MKEISLTWEEKLQKTGEKGGKSFFVNYFSNKLFASAVETQEDRRQALEKAGISVQSSGIKVEKDKYYLVNLNADPALNELLVYYLRQPSGVTRIGRDGEVADIQLSGVGIQVVLSLLQLFSKEMVEYYSLQDEHCEIELVEGSGHLVLRPLPSARTCVNGAEVTAETGLRNGDRILWGSNHFFRVNCPRSASASVSPSPATPSSSATATAGQQQPFDWRMAQEEVMAADLSKNDPLRSAIARLERQHETDKKAALERQRREYERHFQQLKSYMSPTTPYPPYAPLGDPLRTPAVPAPIAPPPPPPPQNSENSVPVGSTNAHPVPSSTTAQPPNRATPSTPMTMSRLEKWGQER